jgi:hypothetical protein
MTPNIQFDIGKVIKLGNHYTITMTYIYFDLPVNPKSPKKIKEYFWEKHSIVIGNTQLRTLMLLQERLSTTHDAYDVLTGIIEYNKLRYTIKNYLDCILKHHINGKINLVKVDGHLVMPNGRPLPKSPEILECIIKQELGD